jgi:hypothetical protein
LKDESDAIREREEAAMADYKDAQAAEEARIKAEEEAAAEELRKAAEATKANSRSHIWLCAFNGCEGWRVVQLTDILSCGGSTGNVFAKMEAKATSPGRVGKDALVREIFEEIDEDGSGFLEFTEIGGLLDRLGLRVDDDEVSEPLRLWPSCRAVLLVACFRGAS